MMWPGSLYVHYIYECVCVYVCGVHDEKMNQYIYIYKAKHKDTLSKGGGKHTINTSSRIFYKYSIIYKYMYKEQ